MKFFCYCKTQLLLSRSPALKVNEQMKNSVILSTIRKTLLRQLVFPVLLLFTALFALFMVPKSNFLFPRPLNFRSHYENFYNPNLPYVSVTVPEIFYSGCNYLVNGRTEGYFYYTLTDGFCQFYLLDEKVDSGRDELSFTGLSFKGRLIELDEREYDTLLREMAAGLDWTASSLRDMSAPFAVSTLPYPVFLTVLFHLLAYGCLFLSLADILSSLYYIWKPHCSPTFRYLGGFGDIRTLLPKVEIEMKHVCIAKAGDIYLTPSYIVNVDNVKSVILPLESVVWIYYHSRMLSLPGFVRYHFRMSYTLHIVADDGKTYDFTRKKKEALDFIITSLEQRDYDILLGYSDENRRLAKEILKMKMRQKRNRVKPVNY